MGGKFLLKLNTIAIPIVNKYREGKMKSTLKKGLNKNLKSQTLEGSAIAPIFLGLFFGPKMRFWSDSVGFAFFPPLQPFEAAGEG